MATLGALAVAVMALILCFVFRVRSRLLSLVVVALGALTTFGVMGYLGIALSLVTISGFPIIIGLAVDFSIQVQSRFQEEVSIDGDGTAAMARTIRNLGPALAIAMMAAAAGFVAIQVSRVPIIRDFGVMLDIAVVLLFLIVITALPALLLAREHRRPSRPHEWGRGGDRTSGSHRRPRRPTCPAPRHAGRRDRRDRRVRGPRGASASKPTHKSGYPKAAASFTTSTRCRPAPASRARSERSSRLRTSRLPASPIGCARSDRDR